MCRLDALVGSTWSNLLSPIFPIMPPTIKDSYLLLIVVAAIALFLFVFFVTEKLTYLLYRKRVEAGGLEKRLSKRPSVFPQPLVVTSAKKMVHLKTVYDATFAPLQVCQQALVECDYEPGDAIRLLKSTKFSLVRSKTKVCEYLFDENDEDIGVAVELSAVLDSTLSNRSLVDLGEEICAIVRHENPPTIGALLALHSIYNSDVTVFDRIDELSVALHDPIEIKSFVRIEYLSE